MDLDLEETSLCVTDNQQKKKKRTWVKPQISTRLSNGQFYKQFQALRENDVEFFNYFRMSQNSFDDLLAFVGPGITHQNTTFRKSIPPEERLAVTLRYLATGDSFFSLHNDYLLGYTTVREIIRETCDVIWECLVPTYMPEKDCEDWLQIAKMFYERTHFPNCIGALGGKYISMKVPKTGDDSVYFLAVADADYCFSSIEVGAYSSSNDCNMFKSSQFGKLFFSNKLNIPSSRTLLDDDEGMAMPFVLVGDGAFAISGNLLRPYPSQNLSDVQKVFNSRLSKARKMVECCFEILTAKWNILHRPLDVNVDFSLAIVKCCCILHNYVRRRDGILFEDTLYSTSLDSMDPVRTRGSTQGLFNRDYFANYFSSPSGSVPWQNDKIGK